MKDSQLFVELGDRRYPILFRRQGLAELVDRVEALAGSGQVLLVSDDRVGPLHGDLLAGLLRARGVGVRSAFFPQGEVHKTLATAATLLDRFLADPLLDRSALVVAMGGGVAGDLGGFVAATLLRGLSLVQVPTSLLAMVDSSVGGKTGVNHPTGKNRIGAFHQPRLVFVDTHYLTTLAPEEIRNGLGEAAKTAAVGDAALLDDLAMHARLLLKGAAPEIQGVVEAAVVVKAAAVAADERDRSGRRAVLNFGHTVGHAIEAAAGFGAIAHGAAVALGMRVAARLSAEEGWLSESDVRRLDEVLDALDQPKDWRAWLNEAVLTRIASDKKARAGQVDFVLLEGLGKARVRALPVVTLLERLRALALRR